MGDQTRRKSCRSFNYAAGVVYRVGPSDDYFSVGECRNDVEVAFTQALNARAEPWVALGVTLINAIRQEYGRDNLLLFLDPPPYSELCSRGGVGGLIRVEHYGTAVVVGYDLTGQGGPDLDPSRPGVFACRAEAPEQLAVGAADRIDELLGVK